MTTAINTTRTTYCIGNVFLKRDFCVKNKRVPNVNELPTEQFIVAISYFEVTDILYYFKAGNLVNVLFYCEFFVVEYMALPGANLREP